MDSILDRLGSVFPFLHSAIFIIGFTSNVTLLTAAFRKTPKTLKTYSIMIKFGTLNDLVCVCCDFFVMQRMLVVPGNLLYLSAGPCSAISARSCYLAYCAQLTTLVYSYYVMLISFAYRLWILYRMPPKNITVFVLMIIAFLPPAITGFAFSYAQASLHTVQSFLREYAPKFLREPGALSGHSGLTPQVIFTILFVIMTPGPVYIGVILIRHKILTKLWKFSSEMSVRTRKMHGNLVKFGPSKRFIWALIYCWMIYCWKKIEALTIHATLPPITIIGVILYLVLFFDLYYHATLEKAIYTFAALPPALSAFCTLYYVEPYRRFISGRSARVSFSTINVSVTYSGAQSVHHKESRFTLS